jgi:hypothetical protein
MLRGSNQEWLQGHMNEGWIQWAWAKAHPFLVIEAINRLLKWMTSGLL